MPAASEPTSPGPSRLVGRGLVEVPTHDGKVLWTDGSGSRPRRTSEDELDAVGHVLILATPAVRPRWSCRSRGLGCGGWAIGVGTARCRRGAIGGGSGRRGRGGGGI